MIYCRHLLSKAQGYNYRHPVISKHYSVVIVDWITPPTMRLQFITSCYLQNFVWHKATITGHPVMCKHITL